MGSDIEVCLELGLPNHSIVRMLPMFRGDTERGSWVFPRDTSMYAGLSLWLPMTSHFYGCFCHLSRFTDVGSQIPKLNMTDRKNRAKQRLLGSSTDSWSDWSQDPLHLRK